MQTRSTRPFSNMTAEGWLNLAASGFAVFYLLQIVLDVIWHNIFGNFASDFGSFWSAGVIANRYGYASVYNLGLMAQVQQPLLPLARNPAFVFHPIPTPYLPIFIVPFQLLALIPPIPAAWTWVVVNFVAWIAYLRFYTLRSTGQTLRARLLTLILISTPVFLNVFTAQVNVWLAISAGEYLRATSSNRPFRAGLWLGLMLLKPQCLFLLAPALLLQRSFKTIGGLLASSAALVGASLLIGGTDAMWQLIKLWLGYASGLPTNDLSLMMNWRMIGVQIAALSSSQVGMAIAIIGVLLTSLACWSMWLRPRRTDSTAFLIATLGTLAATGAVAWHSHVPMSMMLIPPLITLYLTRRDLLGRKLEWWIFLPAGLYFIRIMLASMMHVGVLPASITNFLDFLDGAGPFGLNLYLLGWAIWQTRSPELPAEPAVQAPAP